MNPDDLQTYRRLDTRSQARAAFDDIVARTQRSLRIADDRGEFYGLDRKAFADALQALLLRSREATVELILHDASFVERSCPRVTALLRRFWPRLRILASEESARNYPRSFVLADDTAVLRRPHHGSALTFVDFGDDAVTEARALIGELAAGASVAITPDTTGL